MVKDEFWAFCSNMISWNIWKLMFSFFEESLVVHVDKVKSYFTDLKICWILWTTVQLESDSDVALSTWLSKK